MTEQEQRIAIAEACGWKFDRGSATSPSAATVDVCCWFRENDHVCSKLPDYLHDLNAMHEAEKTLTYQQIRRYVDLLTYRDHVTDREITGENAQLAITAPARLRATAFLHATGLWTE